MEAADGSAPAPPDLLLAWECERWTCLPEAGAYLDQEYVRMHRMTALSNVYAAYTRYRGAKGKEIHNLSDAERRIIKRLIDMELM